MTDEQKFYNRLKRVVKSGEKIVVHEFNFFDYLIDFLDLESDFDTYNRKRKMELYENIAFEFNTGTLIRYSKNRKTHINDMKPPHETYRVNSIEIDPNDPDYSPDIDEYY